ncbi:uncharacterized protein LOC107608767 [Arachis ipaensis]|uniref:uncharacterized protein LOC107608767 n=1 Tax=Arachis ipaensis TaxID=130454 RepID=UPI0007AF3ADD|nr:uncharacterized protein LOC107608767 [Arachis ipaensis]
MESSIRLPHLITPKQVGKQKYPTENSKEFLKRLWELQEKTGRRSWMMLFGHIGQPSKHPLEYPFQLVYGKACNLLVELKNKAFWALKLLNFDNNAAGERRILQLQELEEFRSQVYESAKIYKERAKKKHDLNLALRNFEEG